LKTIKTPSNLQFSIYAKAAASEETVFSETDAALSVKKKSAHVGLISNFWPIGLRRADRKSQIVNHRRVRLFQLTITVIGRII
jgi:hypothetical protein